VLMTPGHVLSQILGIDDNPITYFMLHVMRQCAEARSFVLEIYSVRPCYSRDSHTPQKEEKGEVTHFTMIDEQDSSIGPILVRIFN